MTPKVTQSVELVERLRELDGRFDISPDLHAEAADHIEALEHDLTRSMDTAHFYVNECERLTSRVKELEEALKPLTEAARGLSHGTDWNTGTHAKMHGYRQKLLDALPGALAALNPSPTE